MTTFVRPHDDLLRDAGRRGVQGLLPEDGRAAPAMRP